MDLEKMLSSSCRRRIVRTLLIAGRTNVMDLVRKVNSTYNQVNSNLHILQDEGIVFDQHFGRMPVIRLNKEHPKTKALLEALQMLENSKRKLKQQKATASFH